MARFWEGIRSPSKDFDFWSISTDKSINEIGVVQSLLQNLSVDASTLTSIGTDDPPDCVLEYAGSAVGIEVVGLIDRKAREESAKARRVASSEYYAQWTRQSFQLALVDLVARKESRIRTGIAQGKSASKCDSFWLAIHTDEFLLNSATAEEYLSGWSVESAFLERAYLILSYEPSGRGYPCFPLK